MFRCQFSGEISDGPVFGFSHIVDQSTERQHKVWVRVKESEKPLRVAVEFRPRTYVNRYKDIEGHVEEVLTHSTKMVKEITIRAKHLDAVKKKYGLV